MEQVNSLIDTNRRILLAIWLGNFRRFRSWIWKRISALWIDFNGLGIECHELERIGDMDSEKQKPKNCIEFVFS